MAGRVFLVGAGPGDPGLITVRGREVLARAEVLVYDGLCDAALVALAPPKAERVAVGRWPDRIALRQADIEALLVARAQQGRVVVRLKNGDPMLFGRGDEEAAALSRAGIDFEIVPGVAAVTAAAAWAGIPVTQRGVGSELRCLIAQSGPTPRDWGLDLKAIASAAPSVTFAVYLDPAIVQALAHALIERGRAPESPAAIVADATRSAQRVRSGSLASLAQPAAAADDALKVPAVMFLGEAAAHRAPLAWAERRPLHGRSVVVTRARAQAAEMIAALEELGAEVLTLPCIDVAAPKDPGPLARAVASLGEQDWVVFSSANGIERFFACLEGAEGDARAFGRARIAVVGTATGEALRAHGLRADRVPDEFNAEALARTFTDEEVAGKRFLLVRAQEGREELGQALTARGARVESVAAYRTVRPAADPSAVRERFQSGRLSAVTFASPSAVRNFIEQFAPGEAMELLRRTAIAVIGPVSARAVEKLGVRPAICPAEATAEALVQALAVHFGQGSRG